METSSEPAERPIIKKSVLANTVFGDKAMSEMSTQNAIPGTMVVVLLPNFTANHPIKGIAVSAPSAWMNNNVPNSALDIPKNTCISGNLAAQVANRTPFTKKNVDTETRLLSMDENNRVKLNSFLV